MTDRFSSLTVVLEKDIREDDAEHILNAIRMIKGVLSVKGNVTDINLYITETRVQSKYRDKLWNMFNEEDKNE